MKNTSVNSCTYTSPMAAFSARSFSACTQPCPQTSANGTANGTRFIGMRDIAVAVSFLIIAVVAIICLFAIPVRLLPLLLPVTVIVMRINSRKTPNAKKLANTAPDATFQTTVA